MHRVLGVALPEVCDSHTAGETDPAIHHQQLSVGAVVHPAEVVPLQGMELVHLDAGVLHLLDHRVVHLAGADPVQKHMHRDAVPGPVDQRVREGPPHVARPVDIGLESDGLPGGTDRLQHGREDLVSVLERGNRVAVHQRRAQQRPHGPAELGRIHAVLGVDLVLDLLLA